MPKVYSEKEKLEIKARLKKEAAVCMAQYGVRKTTVDELVKRVKIPKGTFYLFYESKEILLFEVLLELHERVENKLTGMLEAKKGGLAPDVLTDLLTQMYLDTDNEPMFTVMEKDDLSVLMQKLPKDMIEDHMEHDMDMVAMLSSYLPKKEGVDQEGITQALQAVFMMMVYLRNAPGLDINKAVQVLVYGIVLQLF